MMKKIFLIITTLSLFFSFALGIAPSYAQFTKTDVTKTPSKVSTAFLKAKQKCENVLSKVQNSQFGQFVGDGIKYAKKGIKFAKDTIKAVSDVYKEAKDKLENSNAYKIAKLSKEMAKETKVLKSLSSEKNKKQDEVKQEMSLIEEQTTAKIREAQENSRLMQHINGENSEQESIEDVDFNGDSGSRAGISNIEEEIRISADLEIRRYKNEIKRIEKEYRLKMLAQTEKIADIAKKIKKLSEDSKLFSVKKSSKADNGKALQKTVESFTSIKIPTIKKEREIKKARIETLNETGEELVQLKTKLSYERADHSEDSNTMAGVAETMPGKSERSGIDTQVLQKQMNYLYNYINIMITDLRLQSMTKIQEFARIKGNPVKAEFNLCDYAEKEDTSKRGFGKSLMDGISKAKNYVESKAEDIQEKVGDVQSAVEKGKESVQSNIDDYKNATDSFATEGVF